MTAKARRAALRNLAKARRARGGSKRRKRRVRLANRAPRRRRYRMARHKRGGRRKGKFPIGRTIVKVAIFVDGARRVVSVPAEKYKFWITHPQQILKDPKAFAADMGDAAIGVAEIALGPKAVQEVYKLLPNEVKSIKVGSHKAV